MNAAQAGTHVTFTQDAWEAIYKVKDQSYPEERIVGWYHSHPGFGVFLSEHDTFIHENFFSSPNQVAWVYDPHTDEEGCFGWIDGGLHRIPCYRGRADNNGDGDEALRLRRPASSFDEMEDDEPVRIRSASPRSKQSPWMQRSVTALSYLSVLLLGFMICWFLFPHLIGIPRRPAHGNAD